MFEPKPFSRKQKQVLTWWRDGSSVREKDGIIADGAIRSGKTASMSLSFVQWAMNRFDEKFFIFAGKTIFSFRKNVMFTLSDILNSLGYTVEDRRSENRITISRNGRTNHFFIFGGTDERSQDLVQGLTAAGAFFDEVALMPESFVNQAVGRCSVEGSKFWFNCNPDSPMHFFYKDWIQKHKEKNLLYLHFTMNDNLSLSEKIKERYRNSFSGIFYKRFIEGLWVIADGVIYDMFDESLMTYEQPLLEHKKERCRRFVSVDYGTINPTVFLDIYDDGETLFVEREYYYDSRETKRQKTDEEYVTDMLDFIGNDYADKIIIDPSAASFKASLRNAGLTTKDAVNDVNNGIRVASGLFTAGNLKINKSCVNLIKELKSYVWDEKAAMRGDERPVKLFDHACDALRYCVLTMIPKWRYSNNV